MNKIFVVVVILGSLDVFGGISVYFILCCL